MSIFHAALYQPLFNLLIGLYDVIPLKDLGLAIIALTLIVKTALWPLTKASLRSQKALQELQPKLNALKEQYKDDQEGLSKAMLALYKEEKVNPLSSCLPVLFQLPFLFALFAVLRAGISAESLVDLYGFVPNPGEINATFLGLLDLHQSSLILAGIAGVLQFFQTKMLMSRRPSPALRKEEGAKDEDMLAMMNKSMTYFMPVITVVIGASFPGGLALYWVTQNAFSILQQMVVFRGMDKKKAAALEPPKAV